MNGYIGVNNVARKIKTMYIGINGLARKVKKAYIGNSSGKARQWYGGVQDPNTRYERKSIATWNSINNVNTFMERYNHNEGYEDLALGNCIRINDGEYNITWVIAGFDMEHNQTAADGTLYDNGYGICLIPDTQRSVGHGGAWGYGSVANGYISSAMHTTNLVNMCNNLKNILGNHLINRNVLLSSKAGGNGSTAYQWTTSYATLMSAGQLTGNFARNKNKYDDGEANYKLPLFDYENYKPVDSFWLRNIYETFSDEEDHAYYCHSTGGRIDNTTISGSSSLRPLIYLR